MLLSSLKLFFAVCGGSTMSLNRCDCRIVVAACACALLLTTIAPAFAQSVAAPSPTPSPSPRPAAVENRGVASKTTISGEELQQANAQNTYDVIRDVPGVAQADAKAGGSADNLQIRGIHLSSTTGYRLDGGLPIVNDIILSTEDKEQVQVLKGAGALEYGIASPAGIINYVLKRATKDPVSAVSLSGNGFGQAIGAVDVGHRFGAFGFRVNLAGGDTGQYVREAGGTRWLGALTADYTTTRTRVRLDYERFGIDLVENASVLQNKPGTNGLIVLPRIPDPYNLLSGPWAREVAKGQNLQLRTDYHASSALTYVAEYGRSDADRLRRTITQIGTYNVLTGKGTETATLVRDQDFANRYMNLAATFRSTNGSTFENDFTLGFNRNERLSNNPTNGQATFKQNIYNPTPLPAPAFPTTPLVFLPQNSADDDYYVSDSVLLAHRFRITGGLRRIAYTANDKLATGGTNTTSTSFLAPAVGGVLDLSPNVALYGSDVKSLDETGTAPVNAKNAFSVLPPAPATQEEVGLRISGNRGFTATVAYFVIDRANATTDPVTGLFGLDGTNRFNGIEATLRTRLAPEWSIAMSGQDMNAVQHAPADPTINGLVPENVARLSGSATLAYRPRQIAGLELYGGLQFVGQREINPQDQGTIPSVTTSSAGLAYTKRIADKRVTVNLSCKNCGNKRYWSSAVNGALGVAAPRTVALSVRIAGLP